MNVDCQWVEKNLEALFCDRLSDEQNRVARAHIETCAACRKETEALNAIDPLIKSYFSRELEIARRPRVAHKGRVFALGGAAAAVFAFALFLSTHTPATIPAAPPIAGPAEATPVASAEIPPIKNDGTTEPSRTKPTVESSAPADRNPQRPPAEVSSDSQDFLVADPAGYSHSLEEYRGHVVVIGVWSSNQTEAIATMERLYKAHAADSRLRFLGVSNEHQARPAGTTFPVVYNQGSKLLGAKPGEFVLLDEGGAVELRGSLVKDFDSLTKALRGK